MSITLAYIAFTSTNHSRPESPLPPAHGLAFNASRALRRHGGFHMTATLLQISPELFLSGPESTLFAIRDSAISNLTVPPWAMRQLLRYHAAPSALPMAALVNKPPGQQKPDYHQKRPQSGSIKINNVSISDPDLFLEGPFSIHGVFGPFDVDQSQPCDQITFPESNGTDHLSVDWTRIVRLLSFNGFVSFAIGLNSILDNNNIFRDYENLRCVTIFTPPNSGFISSTSPFLDRIVRVHILPQRFTYVELSAADNSSLMTLVPGYNLTVDKFSGNLGINGVEITRPDLFLSEKFVLHGISRNLMWWSFLVLSYSFNIL
ncbi:hypothetical protein DH2020_044562 [Rehmannia glutinosa]|uniref:FAS1 domain-containing protein n=1 Tax=Rehmannia glutinosa TaxID=99300 RepID=A0ABR0UHA1_REHGL